MVVQWRWNGYGICTLILFLSLMYDTTVGFIPRAVDRGAVEKEGEGGEGIGAREPGRAGRMEIRDSVPCPNQIW